MASELEGPIFSHFLAENLILGCLGGILEASWAVLAKFWGRLAPQRRLQDALKSAIIGPKSRPRGAYRSPKRPLGAKNRPKAAYNLLKPPQGGAQTPSKPRFWTILAGFNKKYQTSSKFLKGKFRMKLSFEV